MKQYKTLTIVALIILILPLVMAVKPYCGDGSCSNLEQRLANCPVDCGCVSHPEECNGLDDDCNSLIDENLVEECGVSDVGACKKGTRTCSYGVWGSCIGNIDPIPEVCEGFIDENCNGVVDEGCQCVNGQTRDCGSDVGECQSGTSTCIAGVWGACVGEVPPSIEQCDSLDHDCDGNPYNGIEPDTCQLACTFTWTGNGGNLNCCGDDALEDSPFESFETTMDGRDNDCDGEVDEQSTGETDYTPRTCNADGSATGSICTGLNEDGTDATIDGCVDDPVRTLMSIDDMGVSATKVLTTDTVEVTCYVKCLSSRTKWAIAYNNGNEWVNIDHGACADESGIQPITRNIEIDDVAGTHYFRCMEKYYYEFTGTENCASGYYFDNDDMSIEVIDGGEISEIIECTTLSEPNKQYILNQDIVQLSDTNCIVISANDVTIDCQGHSITSTFDKVGIYSNALRTTIKNCNINMGEGSGARGIELNGADNSYIYNNILNDQSVGLALTNAEHVTAEQNTISSSLYAILVDTSPNNILTNNLLNSNYRAIYSTGSGNNQLTDNTINSNFYGIYLTIGDGNTLRNNVFNSNVYGVYLSSTNENMVENNVLDSNPYGIYLKTSNGNLLEGNTISASTYAVYFYSGSNQNMLGNTIELSHYGFYFKLGLNLEGYAFNGNQLDSNLDTNIINSDLISESTGRIYNKGEQISFDLDMTCINGNSCNDFTYDVSVYPGNDYNAVKNNNVLSISFTPTKEGLYSVVVKITTSQGNTESRKFIFLVGNTDLGTVRYYFHEDPSTHGQYFPSKWGGFDFGSMLSYPATEEKYRTCGSWVQFHPDEILKPLYVIKDISINWWYKVSVDPQRQFTPFIAIEKYSTPLDIYDYKVSVPEAADYTWAQTGLTNLNLISDYLWRPYWLSINLFGENPYVKSIPSTPSYADFTYLYSGPKIEKFEEGNLGDVNLLSSIFTDDNKNNALLELKGEGTFNLAIQMPDTSKDYEIKMDGIDCLPSPNCQLNSQSNGRLDFNLILNGQHTLEILGGEEPSIGGSLVSWGWDGYGQVSNTPTGNDFISAAAGGLHSVALKSDGSLVSWGYDSRGQVSNTPAGNDFVAVSAGAYHNMAIKSV